MGHWELGIEHGALGMKKRQGRQGRGGRQGRDYSIIPPCPPCLPAPHSPPLINKTDTSQEISNCGVGKIARLKQNNIRNLTSSVNRGTTIKTDKCFMLQ
jgi:hypothetical protein